METGSNEHDRVRALIEKAAASVGGQNKLARTIGYSKSEVAQWASGSRPCPAKAQAAMAPYAGLDGPEVLALATLEHESSPQRRSALVKALGKFSAHLGAMAFFALCAATAPGPSRADPVLHDV
jgi:hypothetical protein